MQRGKRSATVKNADTRTRQHSESRYGNPSPLGSGGMGVVYAAEDSRLHRRVALKFSAASGPAHAGAAQLLQEAVLLARINHSRVCRVYDIDLHRGRPCLVMERLIGIDLKQHLAAGRMGTAAVVALALQTVAALEAVHGAGIVHQDIKPANLFITDAGVVKLLDFGLAISLDGADPDEAAATRPALLGTASYIAPERILKRRITPCSDLFSLGAVLYEMATGRKPFTGATPAEQIFNVLDEEPRRPKEWAPTLPRELDDIVMTLLDKRPAHRYQSAGELRRALQRIPAGRRSPRPDDLNPRSPRKGPNHACLHQ